MVAVMAANNETGALSDLRRTTAMAHEAGALVFSDVTQAAGKVQLRLAEWGVDLAVLSAHKIYGPKGIGALVGRSSLLNKLTPLLVGGGQERGARAGTLNTPGIVGFGRAAEIALAEQAADARHTGRLTRVLHDLLLQRLEAVTLNGPVNNRLPNTLNLRFAGAPADALVTCVAGVAMSPGAACYGGTDEPSHVLLAMGQDRTTALEGMRFSLGRTTTIAEVREAADLVAGGAEHVRGLRGTLGRWRAAGDLATMDRSTKRPM
jgi:cysteine desulfurase